MVDIENFAALAASSIDIVRRLGSTARALSQTHTDLLERELTLRRTLTARAAHVMDHVALFRTALSGYSDVLNALRETPPPEEV